MQLPTTIDQKEKVKAIYKNGILTLTLMKKEETKVTPKKIIEIA